MSEVNKTHIETSTPNVELPGYTKENHQEFVEATAVLFENLSAYLKGELTATTEDFKLLETMNLVTKDKYKEMTDISKQLNLFLEDLQLKYREFEPYIKKIDSIDSSITELEQTVHLLDDYTKRLEEKFKRLAVQKKESKKLKA